MAAVIDVDSLVKRYGSLTAVNKVSFAVEQGSVFAFLGPNGAGKSTTIGCLTTLQSADSGTVRINGHLVGKDDAEIRASIGVVFQTSLLDPLLTVRENLRSRARFYRLTDVDGRIARLTKLIDLEEFIDRRYGKLSGGQKRRADIARALVHDPKILFLDEPTSGLDPQSRERVWQTVDELRTSVGLTIFLTTHYLEETERADMVYLIDGGVVVASGSPDALRASYSSDELRLTPIDHETLEAHLRGSGISFAARGDILVVNPATGPEALQILKAAEPHISDFEFRHGSMDDVFLKLTGSATRSEEPVG